MILFLVGGAIASLFDLFLQLACDSTAFSVKWGRQSVELLIGMLAGALCSLTMTGAAQLWPAWTHFAVGLFAGIIAFVFSRGLFRVKATNVA